MQCKYGDPTCPCQDGDLCHYEGDRPMNVSPEFVRFALVREFERRMIRRAKHRRKMHALYKA